MINLESTHRDSLKERETMPDEPQPVTIVDMWWHRDPVQGVMVGPFNQIHAVQYRDAHGRMQTDGHYTRDAALDMALHLSAGRHGRRAAEWDNEAAHDANRATVRAA